MICQALGLAWCATWEGTGLFVKTASDAEQLVVQGHLSLLVVKCDILVKARVGL